MYTVFFQPYSPNYSGSLVLTVEMTSSVTYSFTYRHCKVKYSQLYADNHRTLPTHWPAGDDQAPEAWHVIDCTSFPVY